MMTSSKVQVFLSQVIDVIGCVKYTLKADQLMQRGKPDISYNFLIVFLAGLVPFPHRDDGIKTRVFVRETKLCSTAQSIRTKLGCNWEALPFYAPKGVS